MLTVGSLFAGIGGIDLGLERAGMQARWQVEIEDFPTRVLERHWPSVTRHRDVRQVGKHNLEPVDLICGGFPCQDLSVAGKRAGLAGERSGLFFEFMRVVAELAPRWVLIENVPGLLSSNGGRDMGTVLGTLGELGYGYAYRVLDAQYFGVAQRRRRVFIVGCLGDWRGATEVLFEPESCEGGPAPSRETGSELARDVAASLRGGSGQRGFPLDTENGLTVSHTLKAAKQGDSLDPTHDTYIPVGFQGRDDLAHALRSHASRADKPSSSTYVAAFSAGQGAKAGGIGYQEEQAPTLKAGGSGIDSVPSVVYGVSSNQRGETRLRNVHGSLTASRSGKQYDGVMVAPTLSTKNEVASSSTQRQAWMEQSVQLVGTVRRLTPRECERLQGFPDDWTLIDGDKTPDAPRYRAIGNAVAVPVAEWIGRRIVEHECTHSAR